MASENADLRPTGTGPGVGQVVRSRGRQRVILDLPLASEESTASWAEVLASLVAPHRGGRCSAWSTGYPSLLAALHTQWRGVAIQRCSADKLRNRQAKAPARLREELTEEYQRMIYADAAVAVEQARVRLIKCSFGVRAGVESLDEGARNSLRFSASRARSGRCCAQRTRLERINEAFRRRTTTQAILPCPDAVPPTVLGPCDVANQTADAGRLPRSGRGEGGVNVAPDAHASFPTIVRHERSEISERSVSVHSGASRMTAFARTVVQGVPISDGQSLMLDSRYSRQPGHGWGCAYAADTRSRCRPGVLGIRLSASLVPRT